MKLLYLSNFFNDHQKPLADEFYHILGDGNYYFVETTEFAKDRIKLGFKPYCEPYILRYNKDTSLKIDQMINDADVVICGEAPSALVARRYNSGKLTFRDDESRYKHINRYLKWPIYTWHSLRWNKGYLLCASAFGCRDYHVSGMPVEKCLKWGYFPKVKIYDDIDKLLDLKEQGLKHHQDVSILWVGRLIGLKHPELPVIVASKLKSNGIRFHMELIGIGDMEKKLKMMIIDNNLQDCVELLGSMSPIDVRSHMEKAQIFLFTSDRGEGWGAVLNESMNSACAVVTSPVSGASPYLIENGINGLFFTDQDVDSLYEKVLWLINHPLERRKMGKAAYLTIRDTWSAHNAAISFLKLVDSIQKGIPNPNIKGPCSGAPYLRRDWYNKK